MAARDLLAEALGLPVAERGRIVRRLIESLDQDAAEDPGEVERAWAAELEVRATEALGGATTARGVDEVCAELEAKYPAKR